MVYNIPFSQTLYFGKGILMIFLCYGQVLKINCYNFSFINTSDEHLRFTVNYDDSCVNFLDIRIIRSGKK